MAQARREITFSAASSLGNPLAWPHLAEGPAPLDGIATSAAARVLIGGVGYTNLRDRSFGPLLIEQLQRRTWRADVVVEDLSYGPIDVLFKLQAEAAPFRLGVFVGAVARGRMPGSVERYVWPGETLSPDELQDRIAEAVTGVVSLENLLHILAHFGALPARTVVIEVEPEAEEHWGPELSEAVAVALGTVEALVTGELSACLAENDRLP